MFESGGGGADGLNGVRVKGPQPEFFLSFTCILLLGIDYFN